MVGIILSGHGSFAPGLASALSMIAGSYPLFETVAFEETEAASLAERLVGKIARMREDADGVLVLCDLVGGTPFNIAMMATQQVSDVEVVAGANLPMLIQTLGARATDEGMALAELTELAVAAGQGGVAHRVLRLRDHDGEVI